MVVITGHHCDICNEYDDEYGMILFGGLILEDDVICKACLEKAIIEIERDHDE